MKHFSIALLVALISSANCDGQSTGPLGALNTQSNKSSTLTPLLEASRALGDASADRNSLEQVFDTYRIAVANNNYEAMYSTISRAYQDGLIFQAVFALGSGASGEKADAIMEGAIDENKLKKLLSSMAKDHPLTDQDAIDLYGQSVIDRQKFFAESWTYLASRSQRDKPPNYSKLSDLNIGKNVASGKTRCTSTTHGLIAGDGSSVETTRTTEINMRFIKSEGKWVVATKLEWSQLKKNEGESVLTRPNSIKSRLKVSEANDLADQFAKQKVSDFRIEDYPDRVATFDAVKGEWFVHYSRARGGHTGDHFSITIIDSTGQLKYFGGM